MLAVCRARIASETPKVRAVEAADLDTGPGGGDENTAGATPQFENWATAFPRGFNVEWNVRPCCQGLDVVINSAMNGDPS